MSKLLLIVQWTYAFIRTILQMKKKKAMLIKDFYSADGALHAVETVIIEHNLDGYTRVQSDMGKLFVVPTHILKEIP